MDCVVGYHNRNAPSPGCVPVPRPNSLDTGPRMEAGDVLTTGS